MYLNTSTANVYRASAANSWIYVCNIKGATGAQGAKGATGANGSNGVTPTIKVASGSAIGSVGTPSVTASTSGTTTTFTFNYLKGAKGDKGDAGTNATTTAVATTSANGLMSKDMVTKLNGIATGANNYTLPTASSSTLGGVKTTSTVTSNSGYTACPIISGVPYYKDTNTTYNVASSSSNGLMSAADKVKLDALGAVATYTKTLTVGTDWIDTGITGNNLSSGSYVVQISGMTSSATNMYNEIFTGMMSWYNSTTSSTNSDEILLHKAGANSNDETLYLRTIRTTNGYLKLQIASSRINTSSSYTFKFRRLI